MAPKMPPILYCLPISIIGTSAANIQPCISDKRQPIHAPKPKDWAMVATQQINRSVLINRMICSTGKPTVLPITNGTATVTVYITKTCCSP